MRGIFSLLPDCNSPSGTDWKADARNARPFVANSRAANALAAAMFGPKCIGIDEHVFGKTTRDTDWIPAATSLYETVQGPWGCAALVIGSNRRDADMPSREQLAGWVQQLEMPLLVEEVDCSTEIGRCIIDGVEHPFFAFVGFRFVLHDGTLSGVVTIPEGYNPPPGIYAKPVSVSSRMVDSVCIVTCHADALGQDDIPEFESAPGPHSITRGGKVIINLTGVLRVSDGILNSLWKHVSHMAEMGSKIVLCGVSPELRAQLADAGVYGDLTQAFDIYANETEAGLHLV